MSDTPEIKTLLGFDVGTKRIGIAVGQTISATASPLEIVQVKNTKPDWQQIEKIINEWQPQLLVVGVPHNMRGEVQEMTETAEKFMRQLNGRFKIPVQGIEEILSSYEAKERIKSSRDLDAVAAQTILESWLNEYQNQE